MIGLPKTASRAIFTAKRESLAFIWNIGYLRITLSIGRKESHVAELSGVEAIDVCAMVVACGAMGRG
jgi:hypothetical protein